MKTILKNMSPFNNRTDMPPIQFIIKKVLAFWVCYIAGLFLAEGAAIVLHFVCGKNMLVGDVFDNQTITLIIYYGYIIVIAITLLYWKMIEKRPLSEIGLTKNIRSYFIGILTAVLLLAVSVGIINLILISIIFFYLPSVFKTYGRRAVCTHSGTLSFIVFLG